MSSEVKISEIPRKKSFPTKDSAERCEQPQLPLRVAICGTRGVPARYGGFETFADELSMRLAEQGAEVIVYGRHSLMDGLKARSTQHGAVAVRSTPTIMQKYLETPLHALTSFVDLFLSGGADVVLVCNAANAPFLPILRLRRRWRICVNVDGIERERKKWNALGRLWYRLGEYAAVRFADCVIADAEVIRQYYLETHGVESRVIAYGARTDRVSAGEVLLRFGLQAENYILYVSRLEPENNALGVIEAFGKSRIQDVPLVIVGDAPYAQDYKAQLRQAAEGLNVIFTGFQFGSAYRELLSNSAMYVQATEVGGTHPALIEAMAVGSAVIANGTPENSEVLADAGWLYPVNDFSVLARLMSEVLNSPEERQQRAARAAKRTREHYSWDAVTEQYNKLFAELAARAEG